MASESPNTAQGMQAYRAPSLFQPHRARQALRDAKAGKIPPLMGLYLGLSTVPTARLVAPMGFDAVWVDWEHSSCNVETMTTMVHEIIFMSEGKSIPFVRVPGHDHAAIGFALDAGASIVIPQVETVAEAQHVVSAAKFGRKQRGTRSAPPFRLIPGLTDTCFDATKTIHQNLNEQAAIMIQIETLDAIYNLDAILTEVPDIDSVWLGTLDARVSMDLPANGGMGGTEQEWVDAVAIYDRVTTKHGVAKAGFSFGTPEMLRKMTNDKAFLMVAADVMALAGLAGDLANARANISTIAREENATVNGKAEGAKKVNGEAGLPTREVQANGNGQAEQGSAVGH